MTYFSVFELFELISADDYPQRDYQEEPDPDDGGCGTRQTCQHTRDRDYPGSSFQARASRKLDSRCRDHDLGRRSDTYRPDPGTHYAISC